MVVYFIIISTHLPGQDFLCQNRHFSGSCPTLNSEAWAHSGGILAAARWNAFAEFSPCEI